MKSRVVQERRLLRSRPKREEPDARSVGCHPAALYRKMGDAMDASGYPIWFALCGWEPWYTPIGHKLANSARIGPDTGGGWTTRWTTVLHNLPNALPVSLNPPLGVAVQPTNAKESQVNITRPSMRERYIRFIRYKT